MASIAHNPAFAKKDKSERLKIINDVTTKPQRMEIVDKVAESPRDKATERPLKKITMKIVKK